jgi:hypothetical protein
MQRWKQENLDAHLAPSLCLSPRTPSVTAKGGRSESGATKKQGGERRRRALFAALLASFCRERGVRCRIVRVNPRGLLV